MRPLERPYVQTKNRIFASYLKKTKIMSVKLVSAVVLFVLLLGACSVPKDVVYFQGVDSLTPEQVSKMNQAYTSKICPDDLLTITVTAWDPTVVTPLTPPYTLSPPRERYRRSPPLSCVRTWWTRTAT